MKTMQLPLPGGYSITDILASDKNAYVEHFKEQEVVESLLQVPWPYTAADAEFWISFVAAETARLGCSVNWAIREPRGQLIGGIGFHETAPGRSHRGEIGYWLAKPNWRRGIMTSAVKAICDFATREWGLVRITANVFAHNQRSAVLLEKCGFQFEGTLRKHYRKDKKVFDGLLYAFVV